MSTGHASYIPSSADAFGCARSRHKENTAYTPPRYSDKYYIRSALVSCAQSVKYFLIAHQVEQISC